MTDDPIVYEPLVPPTPPSITNPATDAAQRQLRAVIALHRCMMAILGLFSIMYGYFCTRMFFETEPVDWDLLHFTYFSVVCIMIIGSVGHAMVPWRVNRLRRSALWAAVLVPVTVFIGILGGLGSIAYYVYKLKPGAFMIELDFWFYLVFVVAPTIPYFILAIIASVLLFRSNVRALFIQQEA